MLSPSSQSRVGSRVMLSRGPLRPRDDWAVGADGRVAIVHAGDYSIEWVSPTGERLAGSPNSYRRQRVGRAEKEEWFENQGVEAINVRTMMSASGERSMQFSRGGGDGHRNVGAGSPPVIDVFDSRGIDFAAGCDRPLNNVDALGFIPWQNRPFHHETKE